MSEEEQKTKLDEFRQSYRKLMAWQNNFSAHAFGIYENNGTLYIVMDASDGVTFDKESTLNLSEILKTMQLLTHVVGNYHKDGYLHLDIKPSNFLVYERPSEHVVLFDMDTVTSMRDVQQGRVKGYSYSESWAAPEQKQGKGFKLCPATDLYAIGAILFEKIMGRKVTPADTSIFANWALDGELLADVNPKAKRLLRNIFHKTLSASIRYRYQSADELLEALKEVGQVAAEKMYLLPRCPMSDSKFVGREAELEQLNSMYKNGTKVVFIHGFGGVGKTALALKYCEKYGDQYDCVNFNRYSQGLKNVIDSLELAGTSADDRENHRKNLNVVLEKSKALLVVDNFDVEDDAELEYLLSLNCHILFTTRYDYSQYVSSEQIGTIELETLPEEALLQVFRNEYGKDVSDDEAVIVKQIIKKFGNLTMLVPLVAKQILSSHVTIAEFAKKIENDVFAQFDEDNEDVRITKNGKIQKVNSLDYLRALLDIAYLPDEHKRVLQYLYVLRMHKKLTIEKYREYTGAKNLNVLNDLIFRNWVVLENDDFDGEQQLSLHQLISDLIERDYYPTYDSVPGIAQYIESCFQVLVDMRARGELDWDKAACITFALLMYDDIYKSESMETRAEKMATLYSFMCVAFLENAQKTYELFFESPQESNWFFFVPGIMNWFDFGDQLASYSKWFDWYEEMEQEGLELCFSDGTNVVFESENEKEDFKTMVRSEVDKALHDMAEIAIAMIPYHAMCYYFYHNANQPELAYLSIVQLLLIEKQLESEGIEIMCDEITGIAFLQIRIKYFLSICQKPTFDANADRQTSLGVSIADAYEFYLLLFKLLMKAISQEQDSNLCKQYLQKAEEILILFEEENDRFATYGFTKDEILAYNPPTTEEREQNDEKSSSTKANGWYETVDKALQACSNPYLIYKRLLTFGYQCDVLSNEKVDKLVSENLANRIFDDSRLTIEDKKALLIEHVTTQMRLFASEELTHAEFAERYRPELQLYNMALGKAAQLLPEVTECRMTYWHSALLECLLILEKCLELESTCTIEHIGRCLSMDNIDFLGTIIGLAERIDTFGYSKEAEELDLKVLQLCVEADLSSLSEEVVQTLLYKVRPLALVYDDELALNKIDSIEFTLGRKYCLELIFPQSLALGLSEQGSLAFRFMDDYMEAVATEAYNEMHNGCPIEHLGEMEKILSERWEELLLLADLNEEQWYEPIFQPTDETCCHRGMHIYWALEFYTPKQKEAAIGMCYLVARVCEDIPFTGALEAALLNLTEIEGYEISQEEMEVVLDNVASIYPKFKR